MRYACALRGSEYKVDNEYFSISLKLLAVIGLVAANGFFVATEFSLVSVRRSRIETMVAEGNARARSVLDAVKNLDGYIAATQLGITISSIGLGWIGEPALAALLDPLFESVLPSSWAFISAHTVAFIIAFTIITFLHVVFGELMPKSVALQYPETTSMLVARPTSVFLKVLKPAIVAMNGTGQFILHLVGIRSADPHAQVYTEEELRLIVAASTEGGELVDAEEEIIRRAFTFHDLHAGDIMVPRTELATIPLHASLDEIRQIVTTHKFGRYPVWERNLDDIVGVLYVKELLPVLFTEGSNGRFAIRPLLRPVLAMPMSKPIDELLEELKRQRTHVAVIVDEYGGTAGMVTLGDITKRVIGSVPDEFEALGLDITPEADGTTLVNGLVLLGDVNEYFGLDLEAGEVNTIGGYVFADLGHRPEVGECVAIGPYELRVEGLDGLRIAEVRFIPREDAAAYPEPEQGNGGGHQAAAETPEPVNARTGSNAA